MGPHARQCGGDPVHPHSSKPIPQSEFDAIRIENQRVLIRQMERRVGAQQDRIHTLEMLVVTKSSGCRPRSKSSGGRSGSGKPKRASTPHTTRLTRATVNPDVNRDGSAAPPLSLPVRRSAARQLRAGLPSGGRSSRPLSVMSLNRLRWKWTRVFVLDIGKLSRKDS